MPIEQLRAIALPATVFDEPLDHRLGLDVGVGIGRLQIRTLRADVMEDGRQQTRIAG